MHQKVFISVWKQSGTLGLVNVRVDTKERIRASQRWDVIVSKRKVTTHHVKQGFWAVGYIKAVSI
ncbi:hypothetical protein Plhal304r1_c035g0110071 [Plasmopara halstedii]